MTDLELQAILEQVTRGTVQAKTAIALLVANGEDRQEATRLTFHALGGRDEMESDADGRMRYVGSGRLVSDVERAIAGNGA
jgi:hypothetical protein